MQISAKFVIPSFLTVEYWLRHRLSKSDVCYLLNEVDNKTLWRLVLNLGGSIPLGLLHTSAYRHYELLISGKPKAIEEVIKLVQYKFHDKDKLNVTAANVQVHTPVLPLYCVPAEQFMPLLRGLRDLFVPGGIVSAYVWDFLNITWIPEAQEQSGLRCVRVVVVPPEMVTRLNKFAPRIRLADQTLTLTDERILVTPKR